MTVTKYIRVSTSDKVTIYYVINVKMWDRKLKKMRERKHHLEPGLSPPQDQMQCLHQEPPPPQMFPNNQDPQLQIRTLIKYAPVWHVLLKAMKHLHYVSYVETNSIFNVSSLLAVHQRLAIGVAPSVLMSLLWSENSQIMLRCYPRGSNLCILSRTILKPKIKLWKNR